MRNLCATPVCRVPKSHLRRPGKKGLLTGHSHSLRRLLFFIFLIYKAIGQRAAGKWADVVYGGSNWQVGSGQSGSRQTLWIVPVGKRASGQRADIVAIGSKQRQNG